MAGIFLAAFMDAGGMLAITQLAPLVFLVVLSPFTITTALTPLWIDLANRDVGRDAHTGFKLDLSVCNTSSCVTQADFEHENVTMTLNFTHGGCRWVWTGTERGGICTGFENATVVNGTQGGQMIVVLETASGSFEGEAWEEGKVFRANWTMEISMEEKEMQSFGSK